MPIMRIGATSDMDETTFTNFFEKIIQPEFARIEGVAKVDIIGGENREIKINVNNDKLKFYNISILQISNAIGKSNLNFPTGSIKSREENIMVRLSGKFSSLKELSDLVVANSGDGSQIYLKDVAELYDTKKEASSLTRINGKTSPGDINH